MYMILCRVNKRILSQFSKIVPVKTAYLQYAQTVDKVVFDR